MIKRDELSNPNSCLNKAAEDEPVFVLRAQDVLAPIVVSLWAELAASHDCNDAKVRDAEALANAMRAWPKRKIPG